MLVERFERWPSTPDSLCNAFQVLANCTDLLKILSDHASRDFVQREMAVGSIGGLSAEFQKDVGPIEKPNLEKTVDPHPPLHGVSLKDAAKVMCDADPQLTKELVRRWRNVRSGKLKECGFDPTHKQRKLYEPSAICDWIEKIEGAVIVAENKLRKRLKDLERPVRLP
jgi:hypothetical protein